MSKKEKARQDGEPIPVISSLQDRSDIGSVETARQAHLLRRYAVGYCLAAELALIVWGACPR